MLCSFCGYENLEGADHCDECQASLTHEGGMPNPTEGWQKKIMKDTIRKVGVREPLITKPSGTVKQVVQKMKETGNGCVLVMEDGKLAGIFTERDLLHKLGRPGVDLSDYAVEQMMTASPEVLSEDDTIAYALNKMAMGNFRHVPIEKSDGSFYTLSVHDVLRYVF
ncbi:MAG TPA: CBS domain-containing protein [Bdellovibrionota bacterium]|nr:CBS domain-containing protein [Bdellovibrionota bacterium]